MKEENLDEFADYLAEFEEHVFFDNEECPTCGIKFDFADQASEISAAKFDSPKDANAAYKKLADKGIAAWIENAEDKYNLMVESKDLQKVIIALTD